jgi:hypothetical protein
MHTFPKGATRKRNLNNKKKRTTEILREASKNSLPGNIRLQTKGASLTSLQKNPNMK